MPREIAHIIIYVSDMEKSVHFYRDILALKVNHQEALEWCKFAVGEMTIVLQPGGLKKPQPIKDLMIAFRVQDIDMTYEELKRKGVCFVQPPALQSYGCKTAVFQDPDGHLLELVGN